MKDQCKCGGNLEQIAMTNPRQEGCAAQKTIYCSCMNCNTLYQTKEIMLRYKSGMIAYSETTPYEGLLTKQEITIHAPTLRGSITTADTGLILKQRMRENRRTR